MTKAIQVRPAPLPDSPDELVARRPRTVEHRVEHIMFDGAWKPMHPYLNATCKEDSVEGDVRTDAVVAAMELRKCAQRNGDELVATLNLKELMRIIRKIEHQHGFAPKQRIKEKLAQQMLLPMSDEQPATTTTENG